MFYNVQQIEAEEYEFNAQFDYIKEANAGMTENLATLAAEARWHDVEDIVADLRAPAISKWETCVPVSHQPFVDDIPF